MGSEHLYLANRGLIDLSIAAVCRRHRLSTTDAEDFAGAVRLFLIDDDYAVLRKFQNRSSLRTYLLTVITHRYQDWRNARWGKWRPSAEAKRQGALAVHLERLVVRDGLTLDEACETLRTNFQVMESQRTLEAMAARFPARHGRRFVSDDVLEMEPEPTESADRAVRAREAAAAAEAAATALGKALAALPPQDRLILRMRFEDGFSWAQIARALQLEQKPLYRRVERVLTQLRAWLEASGLTAATAGEILQEQGFDRLFDGGDHGEEIRADVRPFVRADDSAIRATRTR